MDGWTTVGTARLLVLEDGVATYELGFALAPFDGVPNDRLPPEVRAHLGEDGDLHLPYNPTLIQTGEVTVLVDFGAGPEAARDWEEDVGHASDALANAAIGRDQIHIAVITHAHADHLAGFTEIVDEDRMPTFPGVRHLISDAEWRYWVEGDPVGPSAEMVPMARRDLTLLREAGVLELVEGNEEIADGVRLLPTPGHTPGHLSVLVASGGQTATVSGDVILTPLAFEHPEWTAEPDVDPEMLLRTRRAFLDRLVESGGLLFAFHLETPGRVRRAGDAYAFDPVGGSPTP